MIGSTTRGVSAASNSPSGRPRGNSSHLIGESEASISLRSQIEMIAPRPATVLIEGETGVGKEVAARELHACSPRSQQPFVPVDCTAFSTELMESQLFGHVKGAFTGAVTAALGFVRCAHGGTLFLDEIGELPLPVQAKLLRCLQERTVVPVGGTEPIPVDVRIIAATHRDLAQMVREGTFRQDLYFRLNVVRLPIQPLRERREDISALTKHFLAEISANYEESTKAMSLDVVSALEQYDWPGNVRELRNAIERAFLYCTDRTIQLSHLPKEIVGSQREVGGTLPFEQTPFEQTATSHDAIPSLAEAEKMLIARVLRATGGNQMDTARLLNVERHRLRRKIVLHGLEHLARIRRAN